MPGCVPLTEDMIKKGGGCGMCSLGGSRKRRVRKRKKTKRKRRRRKTKRRRTRRKRR